MTAAWDGDDVVGARIRRALDEGNAEQSRIQAFQDGVRDMSGQLGALLRQVGHAWAECESAETLGNITGNEQARLWGVLDEAMATLEWLREGESVADTPSGGAS